MSDFVTPPVTTPGATRTTNTRPGRGYEAQPPIVRTASRKRTILATLGAAAALAAGTMVFAGVGQAQAAVDTMPTVHAEQGPVRTPSGRVRCTGPGEWHATAFVPTTRREHGKHWAQVSIQYRHGGRATIAGTASRTSRVVPVTFCITPSKVQGGHGPIRGIATDLVDGRSRSFPISFR
ncbi:hypothetical protein [Kineosporia succinea]|uniref:Uncharacterized protein n=1 Tax=Kineosporia succinea TaxID=84632 RepID=A0ABT9P9P6_9ACTN|nr:hypothetical protein [Kineosporia succinea]MDP9829419.1 hypothetical protein [Kineosporia succinea]